MHWYISVKVSCIERDWLVSKSMMLLTCHFPSQEPQSTRVEYQWVVTITVYDILLNEVVAKVMFLQVCVCPQGGESVCLSACWDAIPPGTRQTPPRIRQTPSPPTPLGPGRPPPDQADPPRSGRPPGTRQTPPQIRQTPQDQADPPRASRLQHTVYERPVCILLECILVNFIFSFSMVIVPDNLWRDALWYQIPLLYK